MGRYFGIGNSTQGQVVSYYWKGDLWCDCYSVMHRYKWTKDDNIYTACYDTLCRIMYDNKSNQMKPMIEVIHFQEDDDEKKDTLRLGFTNDDKMKKHNVGNHLPEWDGNMCLHCNYEFDSKVMTEDGAKFDELSFMN